MLLASVCCSAQEKKEIGDIRLRVSYALTRNLDRDLLGKTPKNFVYFFSITLSFNDEGKIDTLYFSKELNKNVNDIIMPTESLIKRMKSMNLVYPEYSSKLVFIPIFYHGVDDTSIDYRSGFLKSMENLLPKVNNEMIRKQWVILDPLISPFSLRR